MVHLDIIYISDFYSNVNIVGENLDSVYENLLPGVEVQHSPNITIQNCLFHDATRQAVYY